MATKNKGQRPSEKSQPGTSSTRLEKSRKLAQKRRETYKDLMTGMMESLPFTQDVLTQLDYNSRLRLGLCFLKLAKWKRLLFYAFSTKVCGNEWAVLVMKWRVAQSVQWDSPLTIVHNYYALPHRTCREDKNIFYPRRIAPLQQSNVTVC